MQNCFYTFEGKLTMMNHKPAFNVFSHIRSHAAAAFLVLAAALNVTNTYAQNNAFSAKPPKHELRGVWLTTVRGLDWPKTYSVDEASRLQQQQELTSILDQLQRANVNTVLLQTRVRATALFASEYEPWAQCLSGEGGVSPGYDALQFAIDECHKRGMELHAWMVALPVGKWDDVGCQTLRRNYPSLVRKIGTLGFLSPEAEGTADYLATICREVTRKYDIDGIHLDYMRYPDEWKITVSREEGRRNITRIVEAVSKAVKAEKPWVKMSCSPVGKYSDLSRYSSRNWNARDKVCQEAQVWLRRGLMDQLYPMQYFRDDNFYPFAIDWKENDCGRSISSGLGIYFLDPSEGRWALRDVTRQLHVLRQLGVGHTYFRSRFFTQNTKGLYDYVSTFIDNYPALVPPMTWASDKRPTRPIDVSCTQVSATEQQLQWQGNAPYYNIYCSKDYPVDVTDVRNLVAQRVAGSRLSVPTKQHYYYAVTAMDRYGNESGATQSHDLEPHTSRLIENDGLTMQLPEWEKVIDARYITLETLQGSIVATRLHRPEVSIADISDGMYIVRTLHKKGIAHRLGFLKIDRRSKKQQSTN